MSRTANDQGFSPRDVDALQGEIHRLRSQVAHLEAQLIDLDTLAHWDALVELPNRRSFVAKLESLIADVERSQAAASILFLDVDGLKRINDKFGHRAGDAALIETARMLESVFRKSDCLARLGGDEFAVLLDGADALSAWQSALRVVEASLRWRFSVNNVSLSLSVAVGVGTIQRGDSPQSVLDRADQQMYRIKARYPLK
jgi:diguanylate cyclase (GGDEF)-like protein